MEKFKVIIVEDVPLELKGTEGILHNDIPEAEIIGTAANEPDFWRLLKNQIPTSFCSTSDWVAPQPLALRSAVM